MLKLIGSVMIVAAGGLIGLQKSAELKYRAETLQKLISSLTLLENEISYGKNDTKRALKSIGEIQDFSLFCTASESMNTLSVSDAFMHAASDKKFFFAESDLEILKPFADSLGTTGTTSQLSIIAHTKTLLESACADAREKYSVLGKLYRSMGFLSGIFIAILLI